MWGQTVYLCTLTLPSCVPASPGSPQAEKPHASLQIAPGLSPGVVLRKGLPGWPFQEGALQCGQASPSPALICHRPMLYNLSK